MKNLKITNGIAHSKTIMSLVPPQFNPPKSPKKVIWESPTRYSAFNLEEEVVILKDSKK